MRLRYFAQFGMSVLVVGEMDARFLDLFIAQGVEHTFRDHGHAVVDAHDLALDDRRNDQVDDLLDGDLRLVEHLRNDDHRVVAGRADAEGEVPRRTAHGRYDEPVGRRACVVVDGAADDRSALLGRLVAERRRAGRQRQVVVDRLRDVDVGDGVVLRFEELGDAVGRRCGVVAADGHEQLDVVLGEEIEVEILLEILVGRFETAHREVRTALIEDVVGLRESQVFVAGRGIEKTRITVVQTDHAIPFGKERFGDAAHHRIHARCGTATCKNCNCLFHSALKL